MLYGKPGGSSAELNSGFEAEELLLALKYENNFGDTFLLLFGKNRSIKSEGGGNPL